MKILFLSFSSLKFTEATPLVEPLGGTESAICYLAGALRERGHEVDIQTTVMPDNVYDVVIIANAPQAIQHARHWYPAAKIILWNHMLPDQAAMKDIQSYDFRFDQIVFVSEKQRSMYSTGGAVLPNAIAPCFENLYRSADEILADKECRGAYTSTPFRGLEHLRGIQEIPIDVYSSMRVYQTADDDYAAMFNALSHNPTLRMRGSLSQPALAHALRRCAFLVYPCTFQECHSIAILEAQAAGLMVITTDKAMAFDGYSCIMSSVDDLREVLAMNVARYKDNPRRFAEEQFEQVKHINENYTWAKRAEEWEAMLNGLLKSNEAWKNEGERSRGFIAREEAIMKVGQS